MDITKKILISETSEYEFKSFVEINNSRNWLKTVSAFSNGVGGIIFFGIDDKTHNIIDFDIQKSIENISEQIKIKIVPPPIVTISTVKIDEKTVIKVQVDGGKNTPYYYIGEKSQSTYYRLGNSSVICPPTILNELIMKGNHQTFDSSNSNKLFNDYSFTLFESTFLERTRKYINNPKDYVSFGLLSNDNYLTNAGTLFVDQYIIYNSRAFCTRWNGLTKSSKFEAFDDKEFEGNIIYLYNNMFNFIKQNSKKM